MYQDYWYDKGAISPPLLSIDNPAALNSGRYDMAMHRVSISRYRHSEYAYIITVKDRELNKILSKNFFK